MRHWLPQLLILTLLGVPILDSPVAKAATAKTDDVIVVLGVLKDHNELHKRLTSVLTDALNEPPTVAKSEDLRPLERQCREALCMKAVASQKNATLVMWGNLKRTGRERHLTLGVYEPGTDRSLNRGISGTEEAVESGLAEQARALLTDFRTPPSSSSGEHIGSGAELIIRYRDTGPRRLALRTGLAVVVGALGIAALGGSIALTVLNRRRVEGQCSYNGIDDSCVSEYSGLFGPGYALSALSAVGVGLLVGLR